MAERRRGYALVFLDADEPLFDFGRAKTEALRYCFAARGLGLSAEIERDYDEIRGIL